MENPFYQNRWPPFNVTIFITHVRNENLVNDKEMLQSQTNPCRHEIATPGLEVIKLEFILKLKIKSNDWLLADTCPQASNHCALFWAWACTQVL